jgi:hypothetical protein
MLFRPLAKVMEKSVGVILSSKTISLSDYRWSKAAERLQRRVADAEKVCAIIGDSDAAHRLRFQALADYLQQLPELRELKHEVKNDEDRRRLRR